jgi:hypothetical protein
VTGAVFDGTTSVGFDTDMPIPDLTLLLASLRPFDPDTEPELVDGIPSS